MYQDANTFNETLTIFAQGFMAQRADSLIDFIAPYVSTGTARRCISTPPRTSTTANLTA